MKPITAMRCAVLAALLACGGSSEEAGEAGVVISIPDAYRLGGTATGVAGELVLTEAAAGQVKLSQDGAFWFDTRLPIGTSYAVSVTSVPSDRFCSISNATGTMPRADVESILVTCRPLAILGGD